MTFAKALVTTDFFIYLKFYWKMKTNAKKSKSKLAEIVHTQFGIKKFF